MDSELPGIIRNPTSDAEIAQRILNEWTPEHFCRFATALDRRRDRVSPTSSEAYYFCFLGKIRQILGNNYENPVEERFVLRVESLMNGGHPVHQYNDFELTVGQEKLREACQKIVEEDHGRSSV